MVLSAPELASKDPNGFQDTHHTLPLCPVGVVTTPTTSVQAAVTFKCCTF